MRGTSFSSLRPGPTQSHATSPRLSGLARADRAVRWSAVSVIARRANVPAENARSRVMAANIALLVGPLPSVGQSHLGVFVIGGIEQLSDIDRVEPAANRGLLFVWVNVDRHVLRSELPPAASEPESGHMEAGDFV